MDRRLVVVPRGPPRGSSALPPRCLFDIGGAFGDIFVTAGLSVRDSAPFALRRHRHCRATAAASTLQMVVKWLGRKGSGAHFAVAEIVRSSWI
jgi:hypothetical protein